MTHLVEVHITEGLEQRSQDILVRVSMLQSHLEGAATTISYTKSSAQQKTLSTTEIAEEDDEHAQSFSRRAEDLISQMRSAKVTTSKAIRNLEDLKARSLTLHESTMPAIEQTQSSASELAASSNAVGLSVSKLLSEEGHNVPFTYAEIVSATSIAGQSPFSLVSTKLTATLTHLQTFFALTNSLAQTVEIPPPPAQSPWQLLAQRLKDEAAVSSSHEVELLKLRDEMTDKNTALAIREQIVEEMSVRVEVLEKRINESGGRKEKMRELEIAAEDARAREKELSKQSIRLQQDLKSLESERDALKRSAAVVPGTPTKGNSASLSHSVPSANTVRQIEDLENQISILESTTRYLRRQAHAQHLSSSLSFLSEPLLPQKPPSRTLLQDEARDVLKEMLELITQPDNQMVKIHLPKKEDRLKWRPVKETTAWQYDRMKEEWEGWKEWQKSVVRRGSTRADQKKKPKHEESKGDALAQLQVNLPDMNGFVKGPQQEVRIVRPEEWEEVEGMIGAS